MKKDIVAQELYINIKEEDFLSEYILKYVKQYLKIRHDRINGVSIENAQDVIQSIVLKVRFKNANKKIF